MESKTQDKNEIQEKPDSEIQKTPDNNNTTEESPAIKRDFHGKPKNQPVEIIKLLPPPPPPAPIQPLAIQLPNVFFECFYDGPYDLTLSNRSWGIHRVPPPNRAIVLSEITFALFNASISPSYKKQVILTDDLKFKAFVLDKLVVEKTLDHDNTKEDFEQSLVEIMTMLVCQGGPIIEKPQDNTLLICAYKDFYSNRWRHKSCTIILEKGEVCRPCSYIDKYFQEYSGRQYNSTDKTIVLIN